MYIDLDADKVEEITITHENETEFNFPRMFSKHGFIEATLVDVYDRNSKKQLFKDGEAVKALKFLSDAEKREEPQKIETKRKRNQKGNESDSEDDDDE
jgi:hypothetical protein